MTQTAETPQPDAKLLFDAIRQGDAAQVKALVAANPELGAARNADGATAVLWAIYTRHAELAPVLLAGRDPDFYEACALGRGDRAAELLRSDPKFANSFSADGFPALGLAVFFGHETLARTLVEAGADVNECSRNAIHVYPLHSAVAAGLASLVDLLLAHGARVDVVEFLGATPLHSAAASGNKKIAEKLLAAGADTKRKTNDGKTPADLARQYGHAQLAADLDR